MLLIMRNHHVGQINEIIEDILFDDDLKPLNEMATIGFVVDKHSKRKYIITVDDESSHVGNPYFKIYDSVSVSKANHVARISFLDADIILHSKSKPLMKITKAIGRYINNFMDAPNPNNPQYTNWEECIVQYNLLNGRVTTPTNFHEVDEVCIAKNPRKYRHCLPINLKRPDYTEISLST